MTTRPHLTLSLSRAPSTSRSYRSRHSSVGSDLNVFSDDHELDSPVTIDNEPLTNIPIPRQQYFDDPFADSHASNIASSSSEPRLSTDRNSIRKPRLMIDDDEPSTSQALLDRSLSTSSRTSLARPHSPYRGPTAPSQPYAMYSQMTRASSIASQSTLQPGPESLFVPPRSGPEHPYQLYPQNTVPEEDEDITARGIPVLGFPRHDFSSSSAGSSTEAGDIIGSDGHVERLPPYTRYADNTVAKGNMDEINRRRLSSRPSRSSVTLTNSTQPAPPSNTASTTLLVAPTEQFEEGGEEEERAVAQKEGWKVKARRPVCFGVPLWTATVVILSVVFAGIVGGVVGGIIGNRQGQQQAWAAGAVITTTMWLDADPTTLSPGTSPLPTGHYQIPFNQSEEIHKCITDSNYSPAWGCMDIAYIGLTVSRIQGIYQAVFEDFSVNTADFRYGPQPPDFNGSSFPLAPMSDRDDSELGVAMFFSVLFDKLSIIPEHVLDPNDPGVPISPSSPSPQRREESLDLFKRNAEYDGLPLQPSQKPWFCFWNSTINEVFIYLNEAAPNAPTTSKHIGEIASTTAWAHWAGTTTTLVPTLSSAVALQEVTAGAPPTSSPTPTVFQAYNPTPSRPTDAVLPSKRSFNTALANISNYPKLIKMVEKRKPFNSASPNVQPYCQKMQVLDDMMIVPVPGAPQITIKELEYTTSSTAPASTSTMRVMPRDGVSDAEDAAIAELESYCICEWTSS